MTNVSISESWKIAYPGSEEPKHFDWFAWREAHKFANEVDATSITFSATGMFEPADGRPYARTVYEETLSNDDLAAVSNEWIDERRRRIKAELEQQN